MKNQKDIAWKASFQDNTEIAKRKRAFQELNRTQVRTDRILSDDSSFVPREMARKATFKFKA